jgi:amino acid adenylation domain-containing protein/FkbH-like protein
MDSSLALPIMQSDRVNSHSEDISQTLAIAATYTSEPLREGLRYWIRYFGLPVNIKFASYNQLFQELLNPAGILANNQNGLNVLLVRFDDWIRYSASTAAPAKWKKIVEQGVIDVIAALKTSTGRSTTPHLLLICPSGTGRANTDAEQRRQLFYAEMEDWIEKELNAITGCYVVASSELLRLYGVEEYYDGNLDNQGNIPYVPAFYASLATMVIRRYLAIKNTHSVKAIALDCDQTLWKGVCGEDGALSLELDAGRKFLQEFILAQHNAGRLICLCSKNNEEDVIEVFEKRQDMPLKREHLVTWRLNWERKSENLRQIAEELNLGLDSFVFIDDNPVECAEVVAECPQVLTFRLPDDPRQMINALDHFWPLDHLKVTSEGKKRAEMYRQQKRRNELRKTSLTFEDFIKSLHLEINIRFLNQDEVRRVSELTIRTNQFNTTTKRRTDGEIERLRIEGACKCLIVNVKDRFGDYGLVGVMVYEEVKESLVVDAMLLSCRTLGRGVEYRMLDNVLERARDRGLSRVEVKFLPTSKNKPAQLFLDRVCPRGAQKVEDGYIYSFSVDQSITPTYDRDAVEYMEGETGIVRGTGRDKEIEEIDGRVIPARWSQVAYELNAAQHILNAIEAQAAQSITLRRRSSALVLKPRTGLERYLVNKWHELFGRAEISVSDNFFEMGIDSIQGALFLNRLQQGFDEFIDIVTLFNAPTIIDLAKTLEAKYPDAVKRVCGTSAERSHASAALNSITRYSGIPADSIAGSDGSNGERGRPLSIICGTESRTNKRLPLSFGQQRLWFFSQLEPSSAAYTILIALDFKGSLNAVALEQGLNEIIRRHAVLRTRFVTADDAPAQVIEDAWQLTLSMIDLTDVPVRAREAVLPRLMTEQSKAPFDLARLPLVRGVLVVLDSSMMDGQAQQQVFALTIPHIIFDGWSHGVLLRELSDLYESNLVGEKSPLPELAIQYADYAAWQRHFLDQDWLNAHFSYWKTNLSGAPVALAIPTDRPRPRILRYSGHAESFELSDELTCLLKSLSRQAGVTLFINLLAAFKALLSRYSGEEDIVVGTPIANRNRVETEGLIGFFVNTLVMRTDLSSDPTFTEALRRVREVALGAYAHQDLPFEKLVEWLEPERSLSHTPLFQVMFVMQNAEAETLRLTGLNVHRMRVETGSEKFDLTLELKEDAKGLLGTLKYNTDLFDRVTIKRMLGHYLRLLNGLATSPDLAISKFELLNESERHQVILEWNDSHFRSEGLWLHRLFEAQVGRSPEAIAIASEQGQLSYLELNRRANQLASHMMERGVGVETPVGICVERSPAQIIAILGTLKAGGSYVPLDPQYPRERLEFILNQARVQIVIAQGTALEHLSSGGRQVIVLEEEWELIAGSSQENPAPRALPETLAYVIYTSGSTGEPKGVAVSHNAVCNHLKWRQLNYPLTAEDRFLQKASLSFDISVWEIFGTLISGAQLALARPGEEGNSRYLVRTVIEQQISVIHFAPAVLRVLLEEDLSGCRTLKHVYCGGEALSGEMRDCFYSQLQAKLHHQYGPTETTIDVMIWDVEREDRGPTIPIGRPIANTKAYLLDRRINPTAIGVSGELYVSGECLARGYFDQAALTAEKFVADPFSGQAGARMYRTGDVARGRRGGEIEYLGRIDRQLKVRGFRIEPGEIETVLTRHPQVQAAAVVAAAGQERLIAYIVSERGEGGLTAELSEWLRQRLPGYMVPSRIIGLDELPLNPNGKVDRGALVEREVKEESVGEEAPRTPSEELLASIWRRLLKLERVGINDNFFEVGGHSLIATQVVSRVRESFKVELSVRRVFEAPTIAGMAREIEELRRAGQTSDAPVLTRMPRETAVRASFAQQRLWFLDHLEPGGKSYNVPMAMSLQGRLNVAAICQGLSEVKRRHEVLRTVFRTVNGEPVQEVLPFEAMALPLVNLEELSEEEKAECVRRLIAEAGGRGFDLQKGPLMRAGLLRESEERYVLMLTLHHIVSDGWSSEILLREAGLLYREYGGGKPSPMEELGIQYRDFAQWEQKWVTGGGLEKDAEYWRKQLEGAPAKLNLPTDRPRPAIQTRRGAIEVVEIEGWLTEQLRRLGREETVSMYMVLLAGFKALLSRYSGGEDIVVGTPIANRNRVETEGLIGFFVNTLVMRTDLSSDPTFTEALRRVREVALGAYAHQDLPFEKLVQILRPDREKGSGPFFNVMFDYNRSSNTTSVFPGLSQSRIKIDLETSKFDLMLNITETEQKLTACLEYSTDLFDNTTIVRMLQHFQSLLKGIVADPIQRISALLSSINIDIHPLHTTSLSSSELKAAITYNSQSDRIKRQAELAARRSRLSAGKRDLLEKMLRNN